MPGRNKDKTDNINMDEDKKTSKINNIVFIVLIILVWLGIFAVLIKLDVGGFGSTVMKPIFKDVPVINKILPATEDEETVNSYPYKSLADAITRIKELELELQNLKDDADNNIETIADLEAEVNRLKVFENEQDSFLKLKQQFYDEVVFGDGAIPYENYKTYYESIDPDYAGKLYQQVVQKYLYDERYKELANAYSAMKPAKAAAALYEMTGDLDKVVSILNNMETEKRAKILDALSDVDAVFCGKITVMLSPED